MTPLYGPQMFDGEQLSAGALLRIDGDRIVSYGAGAADAALQLPAGYLVAPGLIDIQVNGGGGVLLNDTPDAATVRRVAQAHARFGTTALLPTFITDAPAGLDRFVAAVRSCMEAGDAGILGVHLEGPYLQPQRRGIHQAQFMLPFGAQDVQRLTALGPRGKTLVTLAPDRVDPAHIGALHAAGALVFGGHTEASYACMAQAVDQGGLCGVTHLFNAMSQLSPRDAGALGYALLHPQLWAGLILDGHHVGRESFEIAWRLRGRGRTVLVSDAMAPAASDITGFLLQGRQIHVRGGRCVDDTGTLAGAAITLSDAVRIGISAYGMRPEDALYCATLAPARLLGLESQRGCLRAGARADLVVFDRDYQVAAVMQSGRWIAVSDRLQALLGAHHV